MIRIARFIVSIAATSVLAGSPIAAAHPDVDDRVARADHRIAHHPRDPHAYLRRGELRIEAGDHDAAEADFRRAHRLDPDLPEVHYYRGLLWLEADDPARAEEALGTFLAARPEHARARLLRARARIELSMTREAVEDISEGLRLLDAPTPEPYVLRARLLASMSPPQLAEAVRGLDEGIERLRAPVALVQLSIDLQIERAEIVDALARLERLPARSRQTPHWHKQRGDLLRRADRDTEAAWAYFTGLVKWSELAPHRRQVPAMARLELELERGLVHIVRDALG